jgi:hypothetical protein
MLHGSPSRLRREQPTGVGLDNHPIRQILPSTPPRH